MYNAYFRPQEMPIVYETSTFILETVQKLRGEKINMAILLFLGVNSIF